jgi:hypothetical protein
LIEIPPEEVYQSIDSHEDQKSISEVVSKAQGVLLNPTAVKEAGGAHKVSEETWKKLISSSPEHEFTHNSVIIEISGNGGHVDWCPATEPQS